MKIRVFIFTACLCITGCIAYDGPADKTKEIVMHVSEEPGIMYSLFDDEGKYPMACMRVLDEDFPYEWHHLAMGEIQGFDYRPGHMYTLSVRRTILANPPADASSYTYRLLAVLDDRIQKEYTGIAVDKEEDIPYEEGCPYHIYRLSEDAFVIGGDGKIHYAGHEDDDIMLDMSFAAVRLEFDIPRESPDFQEYNRWDRLACYAYVLSPLTGKIEKKAMTIGALYLRDVISQDLYNEIVADYASGRTLEYELVLANFSGYGLQKVKFCVTKK